MASKRSGVRSPSAPLICSSSRPADAGLSRSSRPAEQPSARSPALAPSGESHASLGGTVALGRTFVLLALPIGAVVIALLTGTSLGGCRWLGAGLIFIAVSFIASFLWLGFRWLRRTGRRLVRSPRPANPTHG